ncbi:MAG: hypothetical protein K8S87_07035 [Planctomycetes bacterium]|nr:hypothetical protein [Planctomycetota bacterium]
MSGGSGNQGENNDESGKANGGMGGGDVSGAGGTGSELATDFAEKDVKLRSMMQKGEIIGEYFKRGMPPTGKAIKTLESTIDRSKQEAQDAMTDQGVPPEGRKLVIEYFDRMRKFYKSTTDGAESDDSDK